MIRGNFGLRIDESVTRQQVRPGTIRRILPYAKPYRWRMVLLLCATALDAIIAVSIPLILQLVIDNGIMRHRAGYVTMLASAMAGLAVVDALAIFLQAFFSARVGQGLIYDLRTRVFAHVQKQPLAFFTRAQTGSLVSRLNNDIAGAQQALTTLLTQAVSIVMTLTLVLAAIFYLSWQIGVVATLLMPFFIFPGKFLGKRLQRLAREGMLLNAEIGTMATERFNVAGALLTKLYGRPEEEASVFARRAGRIRDITVVTNVYGRAFFISMTLLTSLITALVYGLGGNLVIKGVFQLGTLVALVTLIGRLYGPVNQLTNVQVNALTALVSFDRLFEVLDLKPLISERPGAGALPSVNGTGAPEIEFDHVMFRYPNASEVSLASLESLALPMAERAEDEWVLRGVTFRATAGKLTALVGPSGAGKTTITHLVPRLYDPAEGTVRIGGYDIRDLTLRSLNETVGVVTQDGHLFHDTIRANLSYARPGTTEKDMIEACEAAHVWQLVASLPNGLDTVVGDRGYRLSGGEKQRLALARLLLKNPPIVVLDEATAHLDSQSELAIQHALKAALANRTSLVIAHRLSTVRDADQILVIDDGEIQERGKHDELLASGGLYATLYRTQFAHQADAIEPAVTRTGQPSARSRKRQEGGGR
jgi:ATP-binding cassette subfamily B protein